MQKILSFHLVVYIISRILWKTCQHRTIIETFIRKLQECICNDLKNYTQFIIDNARNVQEIFLHFLWALSSDLRSVGNFLAYSLGADFLFLQETLKMCTGNIIHYSYVLSFNNVLIIRNCTGAFIWEWPPNCLTR